MNIYDAFLCTAKKNKDKILVSYKNINYTYSDVENKSKIMRAAFLKLGVKKNDILGVMMKKSPEYLITVLSLFSLGVKVVPLSMYYTSEELNHLISFINMGYIISDQAIEERLCCKIIEMNDKLFNNCSIDEGVESNGGCLYLLTSGSTGKPKVSIISEKTLFCRIKSEYETFALTPDDVMMINTPLYHCVGFRMMMTAAIYGIRIVLIDSGTPQLWLDTVERMKPTYTMLSPNQIVDIVEYVNLDINKYRSIFSSFRIIVSTGAKLDNKIRDKFLNIVGEKLYNLIGSSETEFIALSKCWLEGKESFCGNLFKDVEIRILNMNTDLDKSGEILCKSNMVFDGYLNDPDSHNKYFYENYFKTGDIGRYENDKLLLLGRKKNLIICSGVNIFPSDIENELLKDERIQECFAFGQPNRRYGEVLCVFIKGDNIKVEDIRRLCLRKLALHQQPHNIYLVEHFFRNEMGKIDTTRMKEAVNKNNNDAIIIIDKYERK